MPLFFILSGFSLTIGYYKRLISKPSTVKELSLDPNNNNNVPNNNEANVMTFLTFQYFRALRVMPVYYILLLASIPPLLCGFGEFDPSNLIVVVVSGITNFIPIFSWFYYIGGLALPYVGPFWTISTLWFFWIHFPYLLRYYDKKTDEELLRSIIYMYIIQIFSGMILWFIAISLFPSAATLVATTTPLGRLPVFIMGICAGLLVMRYPEGHMPWFKYGRWYLAPTLVGGICCETFPNVNAEEFSAISIVQSSQVLVVTLLTFIMDTLVRYVWGGENGIQGSLWLQLINPFSQLCIIVSLTRLGSNTNVVTNVLRHPFFQFLGEISMSLYMVHMLVYFYLRWAFYGHKTIDWPNTFDCSTTYEDDDIKEQACNDILDKFQDDITLPEWNVFIVLPISLLLAILLYYGVEEPIRKKFKG
jgi:peptidoglycan/LPS O-acetylase OafA/YrhL